MSDLQYSIPDGSGGRIFIDQFGSGDYVIEVGKQTIHFEWSDRFGPLPLTKSGMPRDLAWKHRFWRAASLWNLQGQRLEGNKAIWHEPKKPVIKCVGRQIVYAEDGEPGWDW